VLECITSVEFWTSMYSFFVQFKWFFNFKYHFKAFEERFTGLRVEEVLARNVAVNILSLSSCQRVRIVGILRRKSITEVWEQQSTIWVSVMSAHECIDIIFVGELAIQFQSGLKLWSSEPSFICDVKHLKSIHHIKVCLLS